MNAKIKLSIFVVFIAFFGLFAAKPASAMTCNSATIYSTTSTYSTTVNASFEYGTDYNQVSLGEGVPTPTQTIAPGSFIQQLLTGLTGSTTYYYKLIVPTQNAGTDVNQFTTPSCNNTPPPVNQIPTVTLTANPSSIQYGGNSTLSWSSTYADSCSASWTGSTATNGSGIVNPTSTTTYSINCTGSGQQASSSATVYVNQQVQNNPPTVNIYANPSSVSYGGSSTITWSSSNTSYCSVSGGNNNNGYNQNQTSGSLYSGALYSTTTYSIVCTGYSGQQASNSATVYVSGQNYYAPVYTPTYPVYPVQNNTLTVVTTDATQVLNTSAQLNSLIGSSGTSSSANAWFEWGTTIDLGNITNTAAVGSLPSVIHRDTLTGLNPGTTYYFRAVAQNSYLKTTGSILSFTTGGTQDVTVVNQYVHRKSGSALVLITSSVNSDKPMLTIDNSRPHPGDEINLTVNYQNVGDSSVTNATLQISLPQGVDYVSSNPTNPNVFGSSLTFNLGTLRGGSQGLVTIKSRVEDNVADGTILNFPATLSYVDPSGQTQSTNASVSAQVSDENGSNLGGFAFGAGFFPTSIFGWLLLIVLILLLVYLAKYLYEKPRQNGIIRQAPAQLAGRKTTTTTIDHEPTGRKTTTTTIEE